MKNWYYKFYTQLLGTKSLNLHNSCVSQQSKYKHQHTIQKQKQANKNNVPVAKVSG